MFRTPACEGGAGTLPPAAAAQVARALAWAASPPRARDDPPGWLLATQRESFARALAALRRHGIACVADPVGSGKTYVALAVAAAWSRTRPAVCLVPAILLEQWARTAARVGVPVQLHTHERVSRGNLASSGSTLIIIDESHRFREPSTRRYRTLAPWLVGRHALLLTGTPVVNRTHDLLHQLRLAAADDTLAPFGVPSLAELLASGLGHPALSRLVVVGARGATGTDRVGPGPGVIDRPRPRRAELQVRVDDAAVARLASRLDGLRLSTAPDVAALVRVGLLRALASSPAAFSDALARYRGLLRHATDAAAAGRPVTRRDLRRAVGADDSQLVLWALLDASTEGLVELDPVDLPELDVLVEESTAPRADHKAARLASVLADGRVSIVFVTHRATVRHLRHLLRGRVAWCTGSAAGIGAARAPRRVVLAALDPAAPRVGAGVDVVVATDVAAEGLDLQCAERVVHYDLPWTPMRLRQREGRAVRLGSLHAEVEVVLFRPDPAIERRLRMTRTLRSKAALPERLALTTEGRVAFAAGAGGVLDTSAGFSGDHPLVVVAGSEEPGALRQAAGTALLVAATAERCAGSYLEPDTVLLLQQADGSVVPAPPSAVMRLTGVPILRVTGERAGALIHAARSVLRHLYAGPSAASSARLRTAPAELIDRLTLLASAAARDRDDTRIALIDHALRFLRRGHTAGEAMLVTALTRCPVAELIGRLEQLPPEPPARGEWRPLVVVAIRGLSERNG